MLLMQELHQIWVAQPPADLVLRDKATMAAQAGRAIMVAPALQAAAAEPAV